MTKKSLIAVLAALVLTAALAACGGGGTATPVGDAEAGGTLFAQTIIGAQPGCATCHSLETGTVLVGPSMAGIGTRAETRVDGLSAEEYIRQSILDPNAYVVEGFQPGVMVQVWAEELSPVQIDNLVAYLLTLK
jgi:mono/diheme cytochrome c family protein